MDIPGLRSQRKELTENTRQTLLYFTELLRHGYTGPVSFDCSEGGIRQMNFGVSLKPTDVPRRE